MIRNARFSLIAAALCVLAVDAKALQDQQDAAIAKQNAQTEKEFEALSSQ